MLIYKMKVFLGLVLSSLLLSACVGTMPPASLPDSNGVTMNNKGLAALTAMKWTLASVRKNNTVLTHLATDIPVSRYQFVFSADGNVSRQGGCNVGGGGYSLSAPNQMLIDGWRETLMACPGNLGKADSELNEMLSGALTYQVAGQQLQINNATSALSFNGMPTDEARFGGEGILRFIELQSAAGGIVWREALYDSSWIQVNKNAPWERRAFPGIEQFSPEANRHYIVRIKEYREQVTGKTVWVKDMIVTNGSLNR